jgi:hypothetical protein
MYLCNYVFTYISIWISVENKLKTCRQDGGWGGGVPTLPLQSHRMLNIDTFYFASMSDMGDFLSVPHPTPISCQTQHLFHAPNHKVFLPDFQRALQRHNTENSKQIFPEKEFLGLSLNFHIHESVSDLYLYSHDQSMQLHNGAE